VQVSTFYRFVAFTPDELPPLRERLLAIGSAAAVKGTVLLATEGINGTVSGSEAGLEALLAVLRADPRLVTLKEKRSVSELRAFHRLKVRIKREIVTMGCPAVRPAAGVGTYVAPRHWDALIADPDTLLIDARNGYEVAVGSFEGAIDPGTGSFSEFPGWVERQLRPLVAERRPRALALFCTGGIRCEKSTAYLLERGFTGVHHLQGGILRYLEEIPEARSRWRGECFVFDQRVAVRHRLAPGTHCLCHACRMPLSPRDRLLDSYVEGIRCRHCADRRSDADRRRFGERQSQVGLARARGEEHIGRVFPQTDASQGGSAASTAASTAPMGPLM
jgi:UPF0176 protein